MLLFKLIIKTFYRDISIKGLENLPPSGPLIFTPNHPNALLDPLLIFSFPQNYPVRFVAKAPLFEIPVLGWIMRRIKAIPVIRRFEADRAVDYNAFFASCLEALTAGESIVIFPEGRSLPQSRIGSLKTGPARLFFLALEKGVDVRIVPVGLNYEHGSIFRSSVVISVAPPIGADAFIEVYKRSQREVVNELTAEIGRKLSEHVLQTENYQDRKLMNLLERIYRDKQETSSWRERFERLKIFENGLNVLRKSSSHEIEQLRHMLSRYKRLLDLSLIRYDGSSSKGCFNLQVFFITIAGLPLASLGYLFNFIPYRLCNIILYSFKWVDEATMATFKVAYSLVIYPLFYLGEGILIHRLFGWNFSISFAIGIIPLSYFTIFYFERLYDAGFGIPVSSKWLKKILLRRLSKRLYELRNQINKRMDNLSSRLRMEQMERSGN
jgi:glycerol-3-phosphate O-acyltransferase / dihydroxyacetone phosphate acyltransferase